MKCLLFGLTGFGNAVLRGLVETDLCREIIVITRKEKGAFPYYQCDFIYDLCKRFQIECLTGIDLRHKPTLRNIRETKPDLILSATFDQIIPQLLLCMADLAAVNIHPSLLPLYQGATPTNWAIINGEKRSGITFHRLSENVDQGEILYQTAMDIGALTDGELRFKLAMLAQKHVKKFIRELLDGKLVPVHQSSETKTYFPSIFSRQGVNLLKSGKFDQLNIARGLTPYPGIDFLNMEM